MVRNVCRSMSVASLAMLVSMGSAAAQKLETFKLPDPGDKLVFNWVLNGKAQTEEEEFTAAEGAGLRGVLSSL